MNSLKIMAWNVRGAARSQFRRLFLELVQRHKSNIVLLIETRVGGDRASSIIESLGFACSFKVDPMGFVGGIWLLWDNAKVKMVIQNHTFQEIYVVDEVCNSSRVLLTFVYGSPDRDRGHVLWKNLFGIATFVSVPWLVCGDFNEILFSSKKWGGRPACISRMDVTGHPS